MVISRQEALSTGDVSFATVLIESPPNFDFNLLNSFLQRLGDGMTLQRLVVEAAVLCWENDEGDDSDVTSAGP